MSMLQEMSFSHARQQLSDIYDRVFAGQTPVLVRRRGRQEVLVIRRDLVQDNLLAAYQFQPEVMGEADGSVTIALDELDWAVNAPNREEAIVQLVSEVKDYAHGYIKQAQLFLNAPNRRAHLPWVMRILLCESDEEIRSMLGF